MSTPEYLLGIHNFKGRSEDELDISRGDYVEVLEDDSEFNDSWYLGRNLTTNAAGLFPKSFTAPVSALPPDVQRRAAQLEAYNAQQESLDAELDGGQDELSTDQFQSSAYSAPQAPTRQSFVPSNVAPSPPVADQYSRQPPAQQPAQQPLQTSRTTPPTTQGYPEPQTYASKENVPRQPQPVLSKLTIAEPQSPSTDQSVVTGSGPNSASSVDPTFDELYSTKKQGSNLYPQQRPQASQASDIDAAISAMQLAPVHESSAQSVASGSQTSNPVSRETSFSKGPVPTAVLQWTPQNVESYFSSKGLAEDAPKFVRHRITGAILLEMDRDTLKEIDIVSFGPRFEIEKEIRYLRQLVGFGPLSPQSPGSPLSPQSYTATMLGSPAAGASMSSIMNTPVASQSSTYQGYFPPPENSTPALNGQRSVQDLAPPSAPAYGRSSQQSQFTFPNGQPQSQARPENQPVNGYRAPQQQPQQLPQHQQYPSTASSQPIAISQPPYPRYQQQHARSNSNGIFKLKQPGAAASEEEITGSLNSNFSSKHNATAIAAAQAADSGHHRRSSSATSRYSVIPSASQHQRSRTLEEWDANMPPALEEGGTGSANGSIRGHRRNESKNSAFRRSTIHDLPPVNTNVSPQRAGHSRAASTDSKKQKRRSSMLSLLSVSPKKTSQGASSSVGSPNLGSPVGTPNSSQSSKDSVTNGIHVAKGTNGANGSNGNNGVNGVNGKRSSSDNAPTLKSLMMRPGLGKQKTSAFQEGIKNVTAEQAAATAEKAGWMHKRGGSGLGVWSKRFFTLHGTRLSYFTTFKDTKERGLIDITGHRVVPVKDHELLVSLSAAGMGAGRHCFKLIPPGPGYKKGVAFTAPKVHYFAVESAEELRIWQSALMSATIERDESIPVESTCKLPTISLSKAQELMAERLKTKGDIGSLTK